MDLPKGKKFEPYPEEHPLHDKEPFAKTCQCGHGNFNHELSWRRMVGMDHGYCEKCQCPCFKNVGVMGYNKRAEFLKKLGVNED